MLELSQPQLKHCPACAEAMLQHYLYRKAGCDIWQCEACGLGRTDAADFEPDTYYTEDYFSGRHDDGYADYLGTERVLRREFAGTVDFIRRHQPSGRLLEIGCAYGFFLQEARSHFEVHGIELSEDAAAHCRRNRLHVLTGTADEAMLAGLGPMDVIVLLDVIEHLADPHATLVLCARHLRPGGIIVLTTGDFGSPVARWTGASWRLMTPPQHLWFFTRESLERLAGQCGLSIAAFDHPWKLVPASLMLFQLGRMFGWRPQAPRASAIGLPVNLFDAMRVVLRRAS